MIALTISTSPGLRKALDPKQLAAAMDATCKAAAQSLRKHIAVEPGPSHQPVIWASAKERRDYFASRHAHGLPDKYTRNTDFFSERISNSWAVRKQGPASYVVGTRASYARKVQGSKDQTAQHKATGWKTDAVAVNELLRSGDIEKIGKQAIAKYLGA